MSLHWIDWAVVLIPLSLVILISWYTQRYVKGVVEFMTAGRAAGRYLVCNSVGEAQTGAITVIAVFEAWYVSGFAFSWWQQLIAPVVLIVTLTGFVIYRYRESRCMTLAEFFEKRYSKNFRIFMGVVAWIAGTVNFAIFPIIGARFFVYYCGFPQQIQFGALHLPTEAVAMLILLGGALTMALLGGQMTIMVTDCIEGLVSGVMYLIIAVALLWLFPWSQMAMTLSHTPPGKSLLHPFDTGSVQDFNVWYVLISIVGLVYGTMAWQGGHAFKASAANPHEAKMGNTLGVWRGYAKNLMITLLACCAYTYMHDARYSGGAAWVTHSLARIDNDNLRKSMIIPVALSHLLPVGIKGMFASIMLFALIGCDSSYLHSWGSISAQDVILPFRKGPPLNPRQHMRLIRWCIVFVAVFAYCFGLLYPPGKYILMFFALTGAIFLGGAGSVIIGGFYWKKGTTAGAYAGMITGSTIAVAGIIINAVSPNFLINGQWFFFISMVAGVVVYAVVSMLTCREDFNLDRVLHRGPWAVEEYDSGPAKPSAIGQRHWMKAMLGIDEHFTRGDKIQTYVIFGWTMFWFVIFVVFTTWNLIKPWPTSWWATYWHIVGIMFPLAVGVITTTWFTIGGLRDLRVLFKRLDQTQRAGPEFAPEAESDRLATIEIITPIPVADSEAPLS